MGNGTSESGTVSTAPGESDHLVLLPGQTMVRVVVRELSGFPLANAAVTVQVDGHDGTGSHRTDSTGLVEIPMPTGTRYLASATLAGYRTGRAEAHPPTPTATDRYATVRLGFVYTPRHLYAWQNSFLREGLYRKGATDGDDPGRAGEAAAEGTPDRNERLRDFVRILGNEVMPPPSADATPGADTDPELAHLHEVDQNLATMSTSPTVDHDTEIRAVEDEMSPPRRGRDSRPRHRNASQQATAIRAARTGVASRIAARQLELLSHRQLLTHVLDTFRADSAGVFPPWFRYGVIHFSGMRYVNSNQSFYPGDWAAMYLRFAELQGLPPYDAADAEFDDGDAARLAKHYDEARALLGPGGLGRSIDRRHPDALTAILDNPSRSDRADGAHVDRDHHRTESEALDAIKHVHRAMTEQWTTDMTPAESLASLMARHAARQIPDALWSLLVRMTLLRIEQVQEAWSDADLQVQGAPNGVVASNGDWGHIFEGSYMGQWSTRMATNNIPTPWGAECNQVTEMLAMARGVVFPGGITGTAASGRFVPRAGVPLSAPELPRRIGSLWIRRPAAPVVAPPPASTDGTTESPTADPTSTTADAPAAAPGPDVRDRHALWRPADLDEVEQGDIFFLVQWERVGSRHDRPSNLVYTSIPLAFRGPSYSETEDEQQAYLADIPRTDAQRRQYLRAHPGTTPVPPIETQMSQRELDAYRTRHEGRDPDNLRPVRVARDASGPEEAIDNVADLQEASADELESGTPYLLDPGDPGLAALAALPRYKRVRHETENPRTHAITVKHSVVRRHPRSRKYHDVYIFTHEGTVAAVDRSRSMLVTFETAAPIGVSRRALQGWRMVFGRLGDSTAPDLTPFLSRDNLLAPHLDDG